MADRNHEWLWQAAAGWGGSAAEKGLESLLDTPKQARERRKADDKDVDRTLSLSCFLFSPQEPKPESFKEWQSSH